MFRIRLSSRMWHRVKWQKVLAFREKKSPRRGDLKKAVSFLQFKISFGEKFEFLFGVTLNIAFFWDVEPGTLFIRIYLLS